MALRYKRNPPRKKVKIKMDVDFDFARKLGFKTVGIFRAFKEREPRLYALLMQQKEKYDEATIYLSKQILLANKVYPQLWFETTAVSDKNMEPIVPAKNPLRELDEYK